MWITDGMSTTHKDMTEHHDETPRARCSLINIYLQDRVVSDGWSVMLDEDPRRFNSRLSLGRRGELAPSWGVAMFGQQGFPIVCAEGPSYQNQI